VLGGDVDAAFGMTATAVGLTWSAGSEPPDQAMAQSPA
jgi:hypothetical protein